MKFNQVVAVVAIVAFAAQAAAQSVASDALTEAAQSPTGQTIIINPTASQQPATVVEAPPVVESKAEQLRKARQGAEMATEQKIVEKLEESRLKEEQERAERLFGNKLETPKSAEAQAPVQITPVETVVVPEPKLAEPTPAAQSTQVTIEKVEIIQPATSELAPPTIKSVEPAAEATSSLKAEDLEEEKPLRETQIFVGGALGGVNYDASNVRSNFGAGFSAGLILGERIGVEGSFLYSNHFIDTFWNPGIYRELDQYDIGLNAKYYFLTTRLKPYAGAGLSYITRQYRQRIVSAGFGSVSVLDGPNEDQTDSVNLNLSAGADFELTKNFRIGAGVDYSKNLMTRNEFEFFNYYSQLPEGVRPLEEIDFWTIKVTGAVTF